MLSVSVSAGPIFLSTEGLVIMAGRFYIHDLTPDLAAQWLPIIQKIAKDKA